MRLIVIGVGPAGIEAALTASTHSKDVTLITNEDVGSWKSAMPNKWLTSVKEIIQRKSFALPTLEKSIKNLESHHEEKVRNAGVKIVKGTAAFHSDSMIKATLSTGEQSIFYGDKIIVANGSRPTFPERIKPDGERIFSFQNLNSLTTLPSSIIVIGDGPIGYEMVNLFQQIGSKVKWFLPVESQIIDHETTDYLTTYYRNQGVKIIRGPFIRELKNTGNHVVAIREDGEKFESDYAFITLGFRSNVDCLYVENANLKLNQFGSVDVNEYGQTENVKVYVVGDAEMPFSAASSMAKAHTAMLHSLDLKVDPFDTKSLPLAFNENPQVATVGNINSSNPDVHYQKIPYDSRQFRAFMTDHRKGFLKLFFNKNNEIIGGICVGSEAKDIITIVALLVKLQVEIEQVSTFFGSHPSATELPFIALRQFSN